MRINYDKLEPSELCRQIIIVMCVIPEMDSWCQGELFVNKEGEECVFDEGVKFSLPGAIVAMGEDQYLNPNPLIYFLEDKINETRVSKGLEELSIVEWNDLPETKHVHIRELLKGVLKEHGIL